MFKSIIRTPFFKVASLNSVSVILKIGIGIITSKVLAVFVGPAGIALTGNLKNFLTSLENIATLGFQNGILKYVVEAKDDENQLMRLLSTIFITLLAICVGLSVILFLFAGYWSSTLFGSSSSYSVVFKVLALVLPWYASSVYLITVLNGLGNFKQVIYVNIIGNVFGLLFCLFAVSYFQTIGALFSIIIPPVFLFFVTLYYVAKKIPFFAMINRHSFDRKVLQNLSSYSLMALVSSVFGSLVFLAIRNKIIETLGINNAGYWEAMCRISSYYLMFISTILTVYFYPKLASTNSAKATQNVIKSYYLSVLPLFVLAIIILYFLRTYFVKLLFTNEFLPVVNLFFWQVVGDVFKVSSLILGYQFYARKLTLAFIISELFSLVIMYISVNFFIISFGLDGVVMAHAVTYFFYFFALLFYFRKNIF